MYKEDELIKDLKAAVERAKGETHGERQLAEGYKLQTEFVKDAATQLAAKHLERIAELEMEVRSFKQNGRSAITAAMMAGEDTTGMGSVRDAVSYMMENNTRKMGLCWGADEGLINVEIKIL